MSQPADETRLGELLISTGKLTSEELLAAVESQRQQGGPQRKRLGEILVEQGHVTVADLQDTMVLQDKQILWCPRCQVQVNVHGTVPGARYGCRQCQDELQPAPPPRRAAVRETWPAMPMPGGTDEELSEEVRQALADPSRRIGRYAKLEELGRGGMGVVYRCYDPQLHRNVAIKMILDAGAAGDQGLARFKREARAAAKLQHPGIVTLHEVGDHQGDPYLVMDFVEGQTFSSLLENDKPSTRRKVEIIREVARALDHAHDAGITHRDLKPQNVMVDPQGKPHVMDFGLAWDSSARQQITQTGQVLGTPAFMAPEQTGATDDTHGPWTDVYALGAVLYQALVGRPPFQGTTALIVLKKTVADEPEPLRRLDPSISPDLETIALKCLEKETDRRYPSAAAVAEELQRFLDGQAILARPISQSERTIRWTRRNPALSAAMAVVVMVVVAALIGSMAMYRRNQEALLSAKITAERDAARREERARLQAEKKAEKDKESALADADRRKAEEALKQLRTEVAGVLDRVRSGELLADANDFRIERLKLLEHREPETVQLLTAELDEFSDQLAQGQTMRPEKELFLRFLCEALTDMRSQESSVESLGRYLRAELALPADERNQLRAVPAGKALCLLGGGEADRLLMEARGGFGVNNAFWGQVKPLFKRTGVEPELEAETEQGYLERGSLRQDKGDLDGAIADYTRAIEINPSYAGSWANRGTARMNKGDLDGAIADLTRAIEIAPNNAQAWTIRGAMRHTKGNLDAAIADLTRAIEIAPKLAAAWNSRGNSRLLKRDVDGAIADYSRAIEIDANISKIWSNRGEARRLKGDLNGAIADFSRASDIEPNLSGPWASRGLARVEMGDIDGAIADFTHAIELDRNSAQDWSQRGRARGLKGDLDGAIADCNRAIEIDPNLAMVWINRADMRRFMGDFEGAIADYTRGLAIDPIIPEGWAGCARARERTGDLNGAISDYTRAIDVNPNLTTAWGSRGMARKAKGDLVGAIADYSRAIKLDPNYTPAWGNRGDARRNLGDLDGAIADYTRVIDIDPNVAMAWGNRGAVRETKGDLNGAVADFTRAIEIDPTYTHAWGSRGTLRAQMGDLDGAIADWKRFLELAPNHPSAPAVRDAIQDLRAQQRAKAGAGR